MSNKALRHCISVYVQATSLGNYTMQEHPTVCDIMPRGIYLIKDEDVLVAMTEQPYDSEDLLQGMLDKYPLLLAGDQINSDSPRQWLSLAREKGVPDSRDGSDRWSVDNLLLDQDGIPTIVEVKRSTDTRLRREVVAQILDYAAYGVLYWTAESIRSQFEERCKDSKVDPGQRILEKLGISEIEPFWQNVSDNLETGKIRLLFVADYIPIELQRIVEFLNGQMKEAEVLAIEIKQYVGEGHKTLVPRVVGQTAKAQVTKARGRPPRNWEEKSFFEELEARSGSSDAAIARKIFDWAKANGFRIEYGGGQRDGSLFTQYDYNGIPHSTLAMWTYGSIEMQFQWIRTQPPFGPESKRFELLDKLNSIPGVSIPRDGINRRPSIRLALLQDEASLDQFLAVIKWMVEEITKP